jgi:NAD(P)-dependent dehydrogenase (short-subunit alcohol dehydrogenase family)
MRRLEGKTAIVTGAGVGIGEATARRLAKEGAKVVAADINIAGAKTVAAEIQAAGGEAFAHPLDLRDEDSIAALIEAALDRYGSLEILHNNAADTRAEILGHDTAIGLMDPSIWDQTFLANVRGTMLMIKHALPALIAAHDSAIINTSSGAALLGDLYRPAYGASKAAINTLTKYVATQYGKHGVRCNAITPGLILTPAGEANGAEMIAFFVRHALTRKLGRPEDIAAMVALLASDEGRFITAQVIAIDGGTASHFPHVADTYEGFWSEMDAAGSAPRPTDKPAAKAAASQEQQS